MAGIHIPNLEAPMFTEIDGAKFDLCADVTVHIDVEPDEMLGDAAWYISDVYIDARRLHPGTQVRAQCARWRLPVGHPLRQPLMDWLYERCSDQIKDKWEDYLLDTPNRRADAEREARCV